MVQKFYQITLRLLKKVFGQTSLVLKVLVRAGSWVARNHLEINKNNLYFSGASLTAKVRCNSGHSFTWCSSDSIKTVKREIKEINLSLVVYTFLSGIHFQKIKVRKFIFLSPYICGSENTLTKLLNPSH